MARKRKLNKEQERELFRMVQKGFSNNDIAKKYGITESTVREYYRRTLRERSDAAKLRNGGPRGVAMRELGTTLTFDVDNGYVGRMEINGVTEECVFKAIDDVDATTQFDKWVQEMRDEAEFMAMCERKPAMLATDGDEAVVLDEEGKRMDVDVRELLKEYDVDVDGMLDLQKQLTDRIRELEAELEGKEALEQEIEEKDALIAELGKPARNVGTAYALMAVKPQLKGYRLYSDMEEAFAELDRLNEVSRMLGMEDAFEVHEIGWGGND